MTNVFKQFGERGTKSFDDLFLKTRLSLTILYGVIFAVLLFISAGVTRSVFTQRIHQRFNPVQEMMPIRNLAGRAFPTAEEVQEDLLESLFWVNISLLFVATGAGYILAGFTLKPLQMSMAKQRQFLSDASHELRTPLSVLRLGIERDLLNTKDSNQKQHLNEQLADVDRMNRLVSDLLILSKIDESSRIELSVVNGGDVIKKAIKQLEPLARKEEIAVSFINSKKDIFVLADNDLLFRALQNVIKNAIIYNHKKGVVDISLQAKNEDAFFVIKDSGLGIPKSDIKKVFERFTRVDSSRSSKKEGSGLGLPIVRSIVESFSGSIFIESIEEKGTTVTIKIPIHRSS